MVQIFKNTNYNFLRYSKVAIGIAATFVAASIVSVVMHGGFNMSVDFAGGTTVQMKFERPVRDELQNIRNAVSALGLGTPEIKTIGLADNNEIQLTVRNQTESADVNTVLESVKSAIAAALPGNGFTVQSVDNVGPKIGSELTRDAVIVSLLALLVILTYVGLRFKLSYAVSAVLPLGVNVLIILGAFSILNLELTLPFLAAVLTVIGYALNDSIVVFDRVRENLKNGLRGRVFNDVLNSSINQTLSRTIVTSLTTLFTVGALYALGSDSIKDFALALGVGIIVGTLSTIYLSSFILATWHKKWAVAK